MKYKKYIVGIIIFACVLATGLAFSFSQAQASVKIDTSSDTVLTQYDINQQGIVNNITENLKETGVPIKSAKLSPENGLNPPIMVNFVIQSQSTSDKTIPGEVLYINTINRVVTLAQNQGLNIGGLGYAFINVNGNEIYSGIEAVENKEQITSEFNPPFILNDETVSNLVITSIPFDNIVPSKINVVKDECGLRGIFIELHVADVEAANKELPGLMSTMRAIFLGLNSNQQTQISYYRVNLNDASGEPLLIYINDILLKNETWWQTNVISCNLYSSSPRVTQS